MREASGEEHPFSLELETKTICRSSVCETLQASEQREVVEMAILEKGT